MKNFSGNIDFFTRKLADELSPEELNDFSVWISESDENKEEFESFEEIWNGVDIIKGKEAINVDAAWERFTNEVSQNKSTKTIFLKPLMAIAAVVTLALVSWVGYQLYSKKSVDQMVVQTAMYQQKQIVLPDNSVVSANQNSKVTYPKTFDNERRIQLEGEAFFEVTKNPSKPFIVEINDTRVRVLGTSFLISENKANHSVTVVVKTGRVGVYKEGSLDTLYLTPGERVDVKKENKNLVKQVNSEKNYISWKTKDFVFEDESMQNVITQINNSYFSNIQITGEELKNCKVSVSFTGKTLEQILQILEVTLDITIQKEGNVIILDGKGC